MPRGNGTGPMGLGPMTGRAAGYCAGFGLPGYMNPSPGRTLYGGYIPGRRTYPYMAAGRGRAPGFGRGRGRGFAMGRVGGRRAYRGYPLFPRYSQYAPLY